MRQRSFWASNSGAIVVGLVAGLVVGLLNAAMFVWIAPEDHWIRQSWMLVAAGWVLVTSGLHVMICLFTWTLARSMRSNR